MPMLDNSMHERVAQLVASGKTGFEAWRLLRPFDKNPSASAYAVTKRPDVKARVNEIREEVAMRSVLDISRKRELLRQMAEGIIPTSVYNRESGETYDCLKALLADAKLAGEFAPEKLDLSGGQLKVLFEIPRREVADHPVIDATPAAQLVEGDDTSGEPVEGDDDDDRERPDNQPVIDWNLG
jgi:hypothetical protein